MNDGDTTENDAEGSEPDDRSTELSTEEAAFAFRSVSNDETYEDADSETSERTPRRCDFDSTTSEGSEAVTGIDAADIDSTTDTETATLPVPAEDAGRADASVRTDAATTPDGVERSTGESEDSELDPSSVDLTFSRVKIPRNQLRFAQLGDDARYVRLEDVVRANLDLLFPDVEVVDTALFRVTRNAEVRRNEEVAENLIEMIGRCSLSTLGLFRSPAVQRRVAD